MKKILKRDFKMKLNLNSSIRIVAAALIILDILVLNDTPHVNLALGPVALLAITLGAQMLGQGVTAWQNTQAQQDANEHNERLAKEMFALNQNAEREAWQKTNEYNDPANQMQRLKNAGLNPNLIYGKGADAMASPMKAAKAEAPKINPVIRDYGSAFDSIGNAAKDYYVVRNTNAQTDNLFQQNKVLAQDAILKQTQAARNLMETSKSKFELEQAKDLRDGILQQQKLQLQQQQVDIEYKKAMQQLNLDKFDFEKIVKSQDMQKTAEDILNLSAQRAKTEDERRNIQATLGKIENEKTIQQFEIEMNKKGITKSDPAYIRSFGNFMQTLKDKMHYQTNDDARYDEAMTKWLNDRSGTVPKPRKRDIYGNNLIPQK